MSGLSALAHDLDKWTSEREDESLELSSLSHTPAKRRKSCVWSSYFVDSSEIKSCPNEARLLDSAVEKVPARASFIAKKSRELLKLVTANTIDGDGGPQIDWVLIARKLSSESVVYSARDCYIQYTNVDNKQINKGVWQPEEDRHLIALSQANEVLIALKCLKLCSVYVSLFLIS